MHIVCNLLLIILLLFLIYYILYIISTYMHIIWYIYIYRYTKNGYISIFICQADVTNNLDNECKYYPVLAKTTFKERYSNHKSSFNNENSKNSTELSKYVWSLRENNKIPSIKWKIVKIVYSKATLSFCKLCLTETLFIFNALGDEKCLNKKTEFINKCRHQNKLLLKNVKDSMDWNLVWIFVFEYFVRIVFSFYYFFF